MNNALDTKVFPNNLDFKTLENILETLDNIKPIKVNRKEYNAKKGEILEKTGSDKYGDFYILYLAEDLKVYELPAIISRVNKLTFWNKLLEYASKNEMKVKIVITINRLLEILSSNPEKKEDIQRAIKKYVRLYGELFWEQEANNLNKFEYRKRIISLKNEKKYKDYEWKLPKISIKLKTKEQLDNLLDEVESSFSKELTLQFDETFFEKWVNMLRLGMKTITQAEQKILKGKKIDPKKEELFFSKKDEDLDKKERLLRDKIGIEKLKKELGQIRKTWNKEEIAKKEIKATNAILETIYEYPYQNTKNWYSYQPNKILKHKEIYCVWFSLLGHAFLSELWIKHKGLGIISWHSALEVNIGWKKYYFDGTASKKIFEFEYWEKKWVFYEIKLLGNSLNERYFTKPWDTEKILFSQIYNNKWSALFNLKRHDEAIKMYDKAIEFNPQDVSAYKNKWIALKKLKKYEEAIKIYNKVIELNPQYASAYKNKQFCLRKIGKLKPAELYYFSSELMKWKEVFILNPLNLFFIEEKTKVRQLIQEKNYEWLRGYLLSLETEDKK